MGAVIERASGQRYENFLEEEILRPAGMTSTLFDTGILFRQPEVTTLYSPRWTGKRHSLAPSQEWWEDACLRGAGALRTNVTDLLQYLQIFLTPGRIGRERIVSASSVAAMIRPHVPVGGGVHYGYGLAVRPDYHGTLLVSHSGGLKGVSSLIAAAPQRGVAGVVLSNADGAPVSRLLAAAVNPALGLPPKTPFEEIPKRSVVAVPLPPYEGWYCSGEGIWTEIRSRKDHLRLDFRGIEVIAEEPEDGPGGKRSVRGPAPRSVGRLPFPPGRYRAGSTRSSSDGGSFGSDAPPSWAARRGASWSGRALNDALERPFETAQVPDIERARVEGDEQRGAGLLGLGHQPVDELEGRLEAVLGGEELERIDVDHRASLGLGRVPQSSADLAGREAGPGPGRRTVRNR